MWAGTVGLKIKAHSGAREYRNLDGLAGQSAVLRVVQYGSAHRFPPGRLDIGVDTRAIRLMFESRT